MRAAFLGTPAAAIPSLAALTDIAAVELVVTRPDKPRGRSRTPAPPPIKTAAIEWGIAVRQPESHEELESTIREADVDIAVVVAYGRILRAAALGATRLGFVNIHFSLLPRWRGAAPVERAILAGDTMTGVTLMQLDEGLDTGPLLGVHEVSIGPAETAGELTARLAALGATMLVDVLPAYARGRVQPAPQIAAGVTHAPMLTTAEAEITATMDADEAFRMVRAYAPRPGAWTVIDDVRTKVWRVAMADVEVDPGVVAIVDGTPILGLRDGSIRLVSVQPAGKRVMSGSEWARGRHGAAGALSAP
jgi:methionyl-tRNA formyltransferase